MTEKAILEALQKGVLAAVAASSEPTLSIKCAGISLTKPDNGKGWLEIVYIPNNITNEFWGNGKTHRGMMRLILHWQIDGKGAYPPMTLIQAIGGYFTKGLKLADVGNTVSVSINDNFNFLGILEEPPEVLYPISIRYQFFKT